MESINILLLLARWFLCPLVFLTISFFLLVTLLGQNTPVIQLGFFFAYAMDCLLVIVIVLGMQGRVYTTSKKAMQMAKQGEKWQRDCWSKRVIRSWQPLKIGFAWVNFFDRFTGINVLQFSLGQTINLLMM